MKAVGMAGGRVMTGLAAAAARRRTAASIVTAWRTRHREITRRRKALRRVRHVAASKAASKLLWALHAHVFMLRKAKASHAAGEFVSQRHRGSVLGRK